MELIELGHRDFGESRVQQFLQRAAYINEWLSRRESLPNVAAERHAILGGGPELGASEVRWHMIGDVQRNKARRVIECTRLIHSVDSMRVAEELQMAALKIEEPVEVLLQVNCSGENQKHGVSLPAAIHVAEQIDSMTYVDLRGVMTMAPHVENPEDARFAFERCQECFEEIQTAGFGEGRCNLLSMGMSSDFETAIECGANIVRIGSSIFGSGEGEQDDVETDE
jgi:pyridoxal phosphate enzyme (YggS family)